MVYNSKKKDRNKNLKPGPEKFLGKVIKLGGRRRGRVGVF